MKDMQTLLPQPVFSRSFGSGPRRVLAVHCSLAHSGAWRGLAAELDQEAEITCFDLLTHGRSPDWDGQGDFQERNTEAGLSLMQEPVDLIGHSFGATVALRMALARPELVRSLTLIEPVLFLVAGADAPAELDALIELERPFGEAYEAGDPALAARLFNRLWGPGEPRWPDLSENSRAAMTRAIHIVPASKAAIYTDRYGLLDGQGGVEQLQMPVLLLAGAETQPVIRIVNEGLQRRLPDARSATVAGAGHMLPITHAGETAALVRDFWKSC